jgi:putative SOS response-associated peptidase YedK
MCGRFTLTTKPKIIQQMFNLEKMPDDLQPRYNIAPTQNVAVFTGQEPRSLQMFRWGLVPFWAKDINIGNKLINARSETLADKPSFRQAFKQRRCLVLADGFFEWKHAVGKQPYYFQLQDKRPFTFAGLWEEWHETSGTNSVRTCTIITCDPNNVVAPVHNRMPVILDIQAGQHWLDPVFPVEALQELLKPFPDDQLLAYPISKLVNSPTNDTIEVLEPLRQLF